MAEISTIGLDIAKNVFQVHGIAEDGTVAVRRQLRRSEVLKFFTALAPCLVGMEACATSHHWARHLRALGHDVRLLPPAHVKPYVKRGKKNDAADAAAICEAVTRPHMQTVPVKTEEQGYKVWGQSPSTHTARNRSQRNRSQSRFSRIATPQLLNANSLSHPQPRVLFGRTVVIAAPS